MTTPTGRTRRQAAAGAAVWDDQSLGFHPVEPHDYRGESNHDASNEVSDVLGRRRRQHRQSVGYGFRLGAS